MNISPSAQTECPVRLQDGQQKSVWCNGYSTPNDKSHPAPRLEDLYGPDPYDVNFCFPLILESLESERVKLVPFIPRLHAKLFFDAVSADPSLYHYMRFAAPKTLEDFLAVNELVCRRNPANVLFSIMDKDASGEPAFAGIIALMDASPTHLSAEIALAIILRPFQRTHVSSHASGLLLSYNLSLPSASPPGLGLRRVTWMAHAGNAGSIRAAYRMGMRLEGEMRWHWVPPRGKEGNGRKLREGDPRGGEVGRDNLNFAMCWDDWEGGAREKVRRVMARDELALAKL